MVSIGGMSYAPLLAGWRKQAKVWTTESITSLEDCYVRCTRHTSSQHGCILSIPAVNIGRLVWDEIYPRRRATVLGARLMPRIAGRWPGNIDVLTDAPAKNENSYPGKEWFFLIYDIDAIWYVADGLWDVMERCGTSFNLRMIWEDIVLTCDPDNIKVCFDAINCDFLWRDLTYKTILANDFPNYVKGNPFLDILSPSPMPYLRG